jgi:crotonobetainyl-CoA:carnitine CoA-transferase CaiB-like acyl-CoA transferase
MVGEHSREILGELGFADGEIDALVAGGVVGA